MAPVPRQQSLRREQDLREQGLTVGELLLIVLVILVALGGAVLVIRSQQPPISNETTVQPQTLNPVP